ncbi:transportin-3 isoform X2 [Hydra vulgaris]|uniref:Transportin-3 isoform X2 n=1 Tax=Hydra vulgaris TaxID=6087 RepID=A0ABM4BFM2_HYDVU
MERPTLQHVYNAVDALYHSEKLEGKEQASHWLDEFQQSVYAWELSDQILRQHRDQESIYFAAQTMKTKIQYHFAELPKQQHLALRDSLIEHLLQYSLASHATLTQLCLALANMALQSPQWENPVAELVQKFSTKLEHFSILLEILMIMPEEIENENLRIGANRRNEILDSLRSSADQVFELLSKCQELCPADDRTQCKLFQCFGSWLTLGSFPPDKVAKSSLLKLGFNLLLNESISQNLHGAITDCVCNALYISGDIQNQSPLSEACFNFVSTSLPSAFKLAVKNDDLDRSINYARIFAEMGEAFMEPILTNPGNGAGSLQTLDLVLSLAEHPNYEVSEISFNFWYRFSECISDNTPQEMYGVFKPYITKLIFLLCQRAEFEESHDGIPEKGDDFQEYRLRVLDVVHDVVFIIGSSICFAQVFNTLQNQNLPWNKLESKLFVMNPMTRFVKPDDPTPGQLINMILNLPANIHIAVRHTCIVLIGDLAHWIALNDHVLNASFQYLLTSLQHKDLSQMAAHAISKICQKCSHKMNVMFPVLLEVSEAVDLLSVDNEGIINILGGCAMVLSALAVDDITNGLMKLCTPHVQPLYEIVNNKSSADPVKYLDRLASVFRNTHVSVMAGQPHPCKKVIEQLWDLFKMIVEKFKGDEKVMERHFRCLRFGIRCIGPDFMHFLDPFIFLINNLYAEYQHSCLLYIGSILVDEYGGDLTVQKHLLQLFKSFVGPTFTILSREKGLVLHPDTVDDFFRLCIRFLQKCTLGFLKNDSIDSTVQLAIAGTMLDHRDGNQSVMKFFVELIKCTQVEQSNPLFDEVQERVSAVESLLGKYGQEIVKGLVNACAGGVQSYMLPEAADVLWEMLQFCQRPTTLWFKNALSVLPSHNAAGAVNATPEQVEDFYRIISSATSVRVLWREFREFSKYFK